MSSGLRLLLLGTAASALALAAGRVAPAGAAAEVGVAAAVNPAALGRPPSAEERVLFVGANMIADEHVKTGATGRVQLLFVDGSALSVGPNSDLTIDRFVYDPEKKTGQIALNATKGVFRFVGGRISKTNAVEIRTPSATIGIRGGIAVIDVPNESQTTGLFIFGDSMTVTSGGQTQQVTVPGFAVDVQNGSVSDVRPITSSDVTVKNNFENQQGQNQQQNQPADGTQGGGSQPGGPQADGGQGGAQQGNSQQANAPQDGSQQGGPQQDANAQANGSQPQSSPPPAPPNPDQQLAQTGISDANTGGALGATSPQAGPPGGTQSTPQPQAFTIIDPPEEPPPAPPPAPPPPPVVRASLTGYAATVAALGGSGPGSGSSVSAGTFTRSPASFAVTTENGRPVEASLSLGVARGTQPGPADNVTLNFGPQTGTPGPLTTINPTAVGARESAAPASVNGAGASAQLYMVNARDFPVAGPGGQAIQPCVCAYLEWGWWLGQVTHTAGPTAGRVDTLSLAPWVAGTLPSIGALPTAGSATYTGGAVGTVAAAGTTRTATGAFSHTWNFGTRSGQMSLAGFDGRDYAGRSFSNNAREFTANLAATGSFRGQANGSFFASPADAAAYQAGQFTLTGPGGYAGAGVFAGKR